jgi:DNA-binding response OmpR family regulator
LSRHAVLILSADALAAALLGAAVELAGHQPHFPEMNEVAREALRRVRPRLIIVDCDHPDACAESFVGPALMTGSQLLLFDSHRNRDRAVNVARRLGLDVVHLPEDQDVLVRRLRELSG